MDADTDMTGGAGASEDSDRRLAMALQAQEDSRGRRPARARAGLDMPDVVGDLDMDLGDMMGVGGPEARLTHRDFFNRFGDDFDDDDLD